MRKIAFYARKMRMKICFFFGLVLLIFVVIISLVLNYNFKMGCGDYLKLAGDAFTVSEANYFLGKALNYLEEKDKTSGNTGFIFQRPANDIGIWYERLFDSEVATEKFLRREISEENEILVQLFLLRLKNRLCDGQTVIAPAYIAWYPHQWLIAISLIISFIWSLVFGLWWLILKLSE